MRLNGSKGSSVVLQNILESKGRLKKANVVLEGQHRSLGTNGFQGKKKNQWRPWDNRGLCNQAAKMMQEDLVGSSASLKEFSVVPKCLKSVYGSLWSPMGVLGNTKRIWWTP